MSIRWTLADLDKKPALMAQVYAVPKLKKEVKPITKSPIRQNGTGLNKLEQAFYEELKRTVPELKVYPQSLTLKLANGVRYTPDFIVFGDGVFHAYETKGFMRDDAAVKIKVAATLYPMITFYLVTRKKGGWNISPVLP